VHSAGNAVWRRRQWQGIWRGPRRWGVRNDPGANRC
jgi:hypothetical protein